MHIVHLCFYINFLSPGIYSEVSKSQSYTLTQRVYAHRSLTRLLVVEIDLERSDISTPLKLKVKLNRWTTSYDLTFTSEESGMNEVRYDHCNSMLKDFIKTITLFASP